MFPLTMDGLERGMRVLSKESVFVAGFKCE